VTVPCGCCEGVESLTPRSLTNRPGLSALSYRVGTFATFLASMKARLSADELRGLERLTARGTNDFAIALLDGWAAVADVLTFYQERIANEGYLRTATERRSILELARLVGYSLRPGVAASVYLAYNLEANSEVTIPTGSRAQSIPGPGELPQSFETSVPLKASSDWNNLKPRQTRPQILAEVPGVLYLEGISTALKPNDPLLFTFAVGAKADPAVQRVQSVTAEPLVNRTKIVLKAELDTTDSPRSGFDRLGELVNLLSKRRSLPPRSAARLERTVAKTFQRTGEMVPALVNAFRPEIGDQLYTALENAVVTPQLENHVHALRVTAAPFGHNAPLKPILDDRGVPTGFEEWPLTDSITTEIGLITPGLQPGVEIVNRRVTASLKQRTDTDSGFADMPNADAAITLGSETVKVTQDSQGYHFTFTKLGRKVLIKLTDGAPPAVVTVDNDPPKTLQPNEVVRYSRGGRRVTIAVRRGVSVIVEGAIAPAGLDTLTLNAAYDQILPGSWVVVERPQPGQNDPERVIATVKKAARVSKTDFGLTGQVTELTLDTDWLKATDTLLSDIRGITVLAQSEKLAPAEEPITDLIAKGRIELDRLYAGLDSGRWLIVEGERADITDTSGVRAAELVMLASVEQDFELTKPGEGLNALVNEPRPGEKTHTYLNLATELAYSYKRDTVTIYGNVINATHGETRNESLGHGDGTRPLQTFALHQHPLTYVAAPTVAGVQSTLEVRVNNVRWHEAQTLANLGPTDRKFVTRIADDGQVFVTFGNGERGARLPTGVENVRAMYRVGIGKPGNVAAKQVSLLTSRPLGVKDVINPLRASGGADPESRDRGRRNAPLGVMALDRLVATVDYEHFARTFAGIDKASAVALPGAVSSIVHLTIAGSDNIPIDVHSDLYTNLVEALHRFGDPQMSIQVVPCEVKLLVLEATVGFAADYLWEAVEKQIREALLERFGFERQELGEDVRLSEIVSIIHGIPGVAYVDVDVLDSVEEALAADSIALEQRLEELAKAEAAARPPARIIAEMASPDRPLPAQLVVFSRDVPDTLILHGISS
jgi:predicted phage baseplate assembly protein